MLRILGNVLRSQDLTTVEDSIPTFEAFCAHHDVATLAADQAHIGQYEEIVRTYADFANRQSPPKVKGVLSAHLAIRWRSVGLKAIKAITSSEAVGADGGRQLHVVIPIILQNLYPDDEAYLRMLYRRIESMADTDRELALKRRMSVSTVQTVDANPDPETAAMSASTDDADRLAEEEAGMHALRSLKQIFLANNRLQIRLATSAMLRYICANASKHRTTTQRPGSAHARSWHTTVMELVTRWAPVQDRFVMLVTVMETLIRSPITEENLEQQLVLVGLVGWLLRSDINLIGLSIIDVLLGLVQHILLVLQLGGKGSDVLPHHQQTEAIDLFRDTEGLINAPSSTENAVEEQSPSSNRQELLTKLQGCIGDLATHIYYSDQVSDIISAILLRLKPSAASAVSSEAAAIEHPQAAAKAISASVNLQENPNTDEFFSFGTARVTALRAIKGVLTVANMQGSVSGAAASGRNRVGIHVWEGTQWLIRDDDRRVRRAYADALLTWLRLEMSRGDLRVMEDKRELLKRSSRQDLNTGGTGNLSRRAVSNASHREKTAKPARSTFLQLLHLAIYDNAVEAPESESDLLLMHLVLVNLIEKLGVNAAKTGLPMMFRLQEDINLDKVFSTPTAKSNIGSLVHGYLWALTEKFEIDNTRVGRAIHNEITRRKSHRLWLETIRLPPLPLDQTMSVSIPLRDRLPLPVVQRESLKPFDSREALVEQIAEAYTASIATPPTSPPSSPGRVFSLPILSAMPQSPKVDKELPNTIKEAMLSDWTKEACIATVEKESARTVSLSGSRTGTNLSTRNFLAPEGQPARANSPIHMNGSRHASPPGHPNDPSNLNPLKRQPSGQDEGSPTPVSSSDQNPTLRVEDLKRVLAGGRVFSSRGASPLRHSTADRDTAVAPYHRGSISTGSDSIATAGDFESTSDGELSRPLPPVASNPVSSVNSGMKKPSKLPASRVAPAAIKTIPRGSIPASRDRTPPKTPTTPPPPLSRPQTPRSNSFTGRPRSALRPPSSSSSAGEDPISNAKALRGDLVPPIAVPGSPGEMGDEVPPVPPLPASVSLQKNVGISAQIPAQASNSGTPSTVVSDVTSEQAGSARRRRKKKGIDVEALLGSIDGMSGAGERGSRIASSGRPPY